MMRIHTSNIAVIFTMLFYGIVANAQTFEQVYLKDGSVLEGYICEQVPGKSISVQTSMATMVAASDSLLSSSERQVTVANLPSEWKKWVMAQPKTMNQVALNSLKFKNTEFADVYVVENGPSIKFISLANRVYTYPWTAVSKTVKRQRQEGVISGIEDVVILKDGTRQVGQITEQVPGKTIKITTDDNNSTILNASLVATLESQALSDDLSLSEQSPLLDRIYVKGSKTPVEGLITRRQMGKSLTIETTTGEMETIPLADIERYGKFKNPNYKVITDRQLAKGEVVVNGDSEAAWFAPLKSVDGYFVLDEASAVARKGDEIVVEANLANPSGAIYLIKAYRKDIPLNGGKKTVARDVFTYQDLVELALPIEREQTPLGNTKVTFTVEEYGDYILSIQGYQGFIVIHVE